LNPVKRIAAALALAALAFQGRSAAQSAARTAAPAAGFAPIAGIVEGAIARHELPGAVVLVGRGDEIL
jgi:hypothetical protein